MKARFNLIAGICFLLLDGLAVGVAAAPPPGGQIAELLRSGENNLALAKLASAETNFQDALKLARKARDLPGEAAARNAIARVFAGDIWARVSQAQLALEIHHGLGDRQGEASDLARIGELYQIHGFSSKALPFLEQSLAIYRQLEQAADVSLQQENLASAQENLGLYEEAEANYAAALAPSLASGPDLKRTLLLEIKLGTLQAHLGRYENAAENMERALAAIASNKANLADLAPILDRRLVEQSQDALKSLGLRVKKMLETHSGPSSDDERLTRMKLELYESDAGGAIDLNWLAMLDRIIFLSLEQAESMQDHLAEGFNADQIRQFERVFTSRSCEMQTASFLADIYRRFEHPREAGSMNERAWQLYFEELARSHEIVSALGPSEESPIMGERRTAKQLGLTVPPESRETCEKLASRVDDNLWQGDLAVAKGQLDQAIEKYRSAIQRNPLVKPDALVRLALVYKARGDFDHSVATLAEAIEAGEAVQRKLHWSTLTASWSSRQSSLYSEMIDLLQRQGKKEQAFNYAERARARAFLNQVGNRRLPAGSVAPELAREFYQLRQTLVELENYHEAEVQAAAKAKAQGPLAMGGPAGASRPSRLREEDQARQRYGELVGRLKQSNPEYLSLVQVDSSRIEQVQRELLPAATTLVEYYVLSDKTLVWVADRDHLEWFTIDAGARAWQQKVAYFRDLIDHQEPSARSAGAELYDLLVAPIEKSLRNSKVIVVPHDALHYLPFGALWNQRSQRYLVEDHAISTLPSASSLRFLKSKAKTAASGILALGNPDGSLPEAEKEAGAVAAIYGQQPRLRQAASETELRRQLGQVGILHMAAHAQFDAVRPLFSRLQLAPDTTAKETGENADGKLHVHEIYDLDLRSIRLVVLSACETALGHRDLGDEVTGLQRAFHYAGTPAVVSTLWSIEDRASGELMTAFYRHLREGQPTDTALQLAQQEILNQKGWDQPYYWAAFVLSGS